MAHKVIHRGGESKARNQRMQNMFRMIGYGENLGSGFPLILNAWNEKHWLKPELMEQPELMQVKLTLHIQNEPINISLTERQKAILSLLKQNPSYVMFKKQLPQLFACGGSEDPPSQSALLEGVSHWEGVVFRPAQ